MNDTDARPSDAALAFVAGATGYVGRQVVRRLCERGAATLAHVRPASSRLPEWTERFREMGASTVAVPWNPDELARCFATHNPTHVFCLLGTTKARARSEDLRGDIYDAVDYRLTSMLLRVCMAQDEPPRVVYLSSVGASADSRSAYLRARGRIEAELASSGLSYISARPAVITGTDRDDDRPLERLSARLGDGALGIIGRLGGRNLQARYRSTSATLLADGLVHLAFAEAEGVAEGSQLRETDKAS